jgi:hypothetical protein
MIMRGFAYYATTGVAAAMASMVFASPAMAGFPVPGPVVGAGLPALAVIAGGYYLLRRRRRG